MIAQVRQQCVKAGISELETIKCHAALLALETARQAECRVYQKDWSFPYLYLTNTCSLTSTAGFCPIKVYR